MRIVFCGGGTAGHVTPNLALIDKLNDETNYYLGTGGMEKKLTENYVNEGKISEFCEIRAAKLQRKLTAKNLTLPFTLIKSINQAKMHLKELTPTSFSAKAATSGCP